MKSKQLFHRAGKSALYLAYLMAAVLSIIYFFAYRPFVSELAGRGNVSRKVEDLRHVSYETYMRLGWVYPRSNTHFVHFDKAKRPGVLRICALGDSITAGAEVGPDHNYTAYLQRQLEQLGADNVEVINFGNGWYGFSQVAVMWHEVARNFKCDLLLLMVFDFWWERDTTFNHTNFSDPYFLHARYVIADGRLSLIEVAGETFQDRFDRYYGFIPSWRYLRYDRHVPAAIQALLPLSMRIPNPFYHQTGPRSEAHRIYRYLMSWITDTAAPMIVMSRVGDSALAAVMEDEYPNVTFAVRTNHGDRLGSFPYWAPIFHETAWEHQITARRFVRVLLRDLPPPIPVLRFTDPAARDFWVPPPPINAGGSLTVDISAGTIGVIVSVHDRETEREDRHRRTLADTSVVGLLAIRGSGETTLDACLLPLRSGLSPGTHVEMAMEGRAPFDLGVVRLVAPGIGLWVLERSGVTCGLHGPLSIPIQGEGTDGPVSLVAGVSAFPARLRSGVLILGEAGAPMFRFRALGQFLADAERLPDEGRVTIAGIEVSRWTLLRDYADVRVLRSAGFSLEIRSGRAELIERKPRVVERLYRDNVSINNCMGCSPNPSH